MELKVKSNVSWVGKIDWELRWFHGNEYSTHKGSTYNSYLVREEKTVLIDTVWRPFAAEFVRNLESLIDLKKIDYVIANHAEIDHSGALPELMARIPDTPIICSPMGVKNIKGHYHQDWNFKPVKTGDTLDLGNGKKLVFMEMKMLHWPDNMMEFMTGDNILFSNDAFGQHLASEHMFNDLVDPKELYYECLKYYANILTPFNEFVDKKLQEVLALNLPVEMICTSHGVIWRTDPMQNVRNYAQWCNNYQENQVTVVYDSMWDGTRALAEKIAWGIHEADPKVTVKVFKISKSDKNDVVTEIFRSKAVVFGSPTINRGVLTAMASLMEELRGLGMKNKKAASFGCYGWSGESVKVLNEGLTYAGFTVVGEGLKHQWMPDDAVLARAEQYGRDLTAKFA